MSEYRVVHRGQIEDEFTGFDGDALFALTDGSCWLQDEYKYWYHYAYRPRVEIIEEHGRLYLGIENSDQHVAVRRTNGLVQSQIRGAFTGWNGKSEYKLTNGQVWKQSRYHYTYVYAYRPQVRIYDAGSGLVMEVAGTRANVKRVR